MGGETLNVGIGQGYMLATPMQLAVMAARLGNGTSKVMPRIARSTTGPDVPFFETLNIDPEVLAVVREGMVVPPRSLVVGVPAVVKRELTERELEIIARTPVRYREYAELTRQALAEHG